MKVKYFPEMSGLSLWLAWNDAIDSGDVPLEASDGTQFLQIDYQFIMSAARTDGWSVALHPEDVVRARYAINGNPENLALKKAKKPYRLE